MKLTEAQLKAIVAEEIQAAIEEGLFGALGGAARGAASALGGAAKTVGSAVGKAAGDVAQAAKSGAAEAKLQSAVSTAQTLGSKYAPTFKALGSSPESKRIALGVIEMLASEAGIDLSDYKEFKAGELAQGKAALAAGAKASAEDPERDTWWRGQGGPLRAASPAAMAKESVDKSASKIAESIVRRITQESKRRR